MSLDGPEDADWNSTLDPPAGHRSEQASDVGCQGLEEAVSDARCQVQSGTKQRRPEAFRIEGTKLKCL